MTKNFIQWKRTPITSSVEILAVVYLSLHIASWRLTQEDYPQDYSAYIDSRASFYPNSQIDPKTGNWSSNYIFTQGQKTNFNDFMLWANSTTDPMSDFKSPYWLNPSSCYQNATSKYGPTVHLYSSPIIGYIKNNNQIELDILEQLRILFDGQKSMVAMLTNLWKSGLAAQMGLNITEILVFDAFQIDRKTFNFFTEYGPGSFQFKAFSSMNEYQTYIQSPLYGSKEVPGICFGFSINETSHNKFQLELMFTDTPSWSGKIPYQTRPAFKQDGFNPDSWGNFGISQTYGYQLMENLAANTILKRKSGVNNATILAMVLPHSHQQMMRHSNFWYMSAYSHLLVVCMWVPLVYSTVFRIVLEKQQKIQETMLIMGMSEVAYWGSWYAYYSAISTLIAFIAFTILQLIVFKTSEPLILFALLWGFGQSLFGLILVSQSLFSQARWASIFTTLFYFSVTQFHFGLLEEGVGGIKRFLCAFSPGICMAQILRNINYWDEFGGGCNFQNWKYLLFDLSVQEGLAILYGASLFWLAFGIFLDNAIPKAYGVKQNWLAGLFKCGRQQLQNTVAPSIQKSNFDTNYMSEDCFEQVTQETAIKESQNLILKIADLFKVYGDGFKAVNGINLKLYQDQIFVLLGHNGAGKTTTIGMLSGLLPKTGGEASVFGVNLFEKMQEARKFMGVCPQYDVLFDLLTPEEHLDFFYEMKGGPLKQVAKQAEIQKLMVDVGVDDKKNAMVKTLSGGNKRKLSVAIALVGGSKFLIFDEPTAGMDLNARRHLWECLKVYKKNRIILMSTHYMDEADILGDRIGIMTGGKLSAVGSSIFLKTKFGIGYNMILVKDSIMPNTKLMPYLKQHLGPLVVKTSEIQSEITLKIASEYSVKFSKFFDLFDNDLQSLDIRNYGISISTLEEVFMKIGHVTEVKTSGGKIEQDNNFFSKEALNNSQIMDNELVTIDDSSIDWGLGKNAKDIDTSFKNNLKAVLYKRFRSYKNGKFAIIFEIAPIVMGIVGICMVLVADEWSNSPPVIYSADLVPRGSQVMFNSQIYDSKNSNINLSDLLANFPTQNLNITLNERGSKSIYHYNNQTLSFANKSSSLPWHYGDYFIFQANNQTMDYKFLNWVNTTNFGPAFIYPNIMYETILKTATGDPQLEFKVKSTPPPKVWSMTDKWRSTLVLQYGFGVSLGVFLSILVGGLVQERTSGRKHLQRLAGLQIQAYWIGNFIIDFIKLETLVICDCIALYFVGFHYKTVFYILPLAPLSIIPFAYVISFVFQSDNLAYLCTILGVFFVNGLIAMLNMYDRMGDQADKADRIQWLLKLIPYFIFSDVTFTEEAGVRMSLQREFRQTKNTPISQNLWDFYQQGGTIMMIFINCSFWTIILVMIELGCFKCKAKDNEKSETVTEEPDEDVAAENKRIASGCTDQIIVQNFSKQFKALNAKTCKSNKFFAVSNLSFALKTGECFSLLGVNGAGKSTTFKSLTKEIGDTTGFIQICGFDIEKDFGKARKLIGYCPQYNLIFENLTVYEHVCYYATVKGIPAHVKQQIIEETISRLGLTSQQDKLVSSLSGGNQRKVMVAMALVGNPPIILLDEPSAGMDPEARRFMWNVVAKITERQQSAIVLTTHSMEEAEALSTKMGIMVKGGIFKCYGSSQHIRHKFGTGFVIEIKVRTLNENELDQRKGDFFEGEKLLGSKVNFMSAKLRSDFLEGSQKYEETDLLRFVHAQVNLLRGIFEFCGTFEQVELLESHGNYIQVRVQRNGFTIGKVFGLIEKLKDSLEISEYSVSQTSLEQIFQNFADVHYSEQIKVYLKSEDNLLKQLDGFEKTKKENDEQEFQDEEKSVVATNKPDQFSSPARKNRKIVIPQPKQTAGLGIEMTHAKRARKYEEFNLQSISDICEDFSRASPAFQ